MPSILDLAIRSNHLVHCTTSVVASKNTFVPTCNIAEMILASSERQTANMPTSGKQLRPDLVGSTTVVLTGEQKDLYAEHHLYLATTNTERTRKIQPRCMSGQVARSVEYGLMKNTIGTEPSWAELGWAGLGKGVIWLGCLHKSTRSSQPTNFRIIPGYGEQQIVFNPFVVLSSNRPDNFHKIATRSLMNDENKSVLTPETATLADGDGDCSQPPTDNSQSTTLISHFKRSLPPADRSFAQCESHI